MLFNPGGGTIQWPLFLHLFSCSNLFRKCSLRPMFNLALCLDILVARFPALFAVCSLFARSSCSSIRSNVPTWKRPSLSATTKLPCDANPSTCSDAAVSISFGDGSSAASPFQATATNSGRRTVDNEIDVDKSAKIEACNKAGSMAMPWPLKSVEMP